jgi:PAS domain S-box-containing protein
VFSFRTKVAALVSLLIGMISLFIFFFFPSRLEKQATRAVIAKAHSIGEMTAFSVSPALYFEDVESILEVFESAKQNRDLKSLMVTDATGREVASFGAEQVQRAEFQELAGSGKLSSDGEFYYCVIPVVHNGREIGRFSLCLSLEDLRHEIRRSRETIGLVSFAVFLIGIVAAFGVSTVITKPLRHMAETAEGIAKGDLKKRAAISSRDEVGLLASSFNTMVGNLETAYGKLEKANRVLDAHARDLQNEIAERERAERAIRESEERLKTIISSMQAGIVVIDAATRTIVDANPVAIAMLGASREEVIGTPSEKFISENGKQWAPEATGREVVSGEATLHKETGEAIPILMTKVSVMLGGRDHILENFIDLTERKLLEEELMKTQKLESVGVLAGGIAHDFNNALTAILGNLALARMQSGLGGEFQQLLSSAEKATLKAKGLTQQLLTFSKGGAPIRKVSSLSDLLQETAGFALTGSNVRCHLSLPENLWAVEIDEGQISQVINNLVINARDAMPEGGSLEIRAENVSVTGGEVPRLESGRYVKVSVKDEGTGISEEILPRIFDPYFTTKKKGSGLGLATTYSIVKQHGGHVQVESTVGVGTRFFIYLPASNEKVPSKMKEPEKTYRGGGKVLLMDDDESILESVGALLEHLGYEVVLARDGLEVVALYREALHTLRPFGAVIMDLTIPGGVGGKEAVGKLIEIDPHVRAIVSSGYSSDPVMANYKSYGFSGVVAKPYDVTQLDEALQKILKNGHGPSALKPSA